MPSLQRQALCAAFVERGLGVDARMAWHRMIEWFGSSGS